MRKHLTAALVVLLALGMAGMTTAQTDYDEDDMDSSNITISIASEIAIDVHPQSLDFTGTSVGTQVTSSDSPESYTAIDLENTGSEYIDRIWANATQTTVADAQFGRSANDEQDFDAGNMFQLKPNNASGKLLGDSDNYNFVNRRDYATYNDSLIPSYINAPESGTYFTSTGGTSSNPNEVAVGRFRMGDQEYFYAIPTDGQCEGGGSTTYNTMFVAKEPHNSTTTAPIDFTTGNGFDYISNRDYYWYNMTSVSGSNNYGAVTEEDDPGTSGLTLSSPTTGETRTYAALTHCDTDGSSSAEASQDDPHVIRTRYNTEAGSATNLAEQSDVAAAEYLLNSPSSASDQLAPSQAVTFDVAIEVPRGVPEGTVDFGQLRLVVTADTSTT